MANAKDLFIICFLLSCVGNVISGLPDKNPEEMGQNEFESIEKRVAEMVEIRVRQEISKLKDEIKSELSVDQALTGTRGYSTTRLFSSLPNPTRKILLLDRVVE